MARLRCPACGFVTGTDIEGLAHLELSEHLLEEASEGDEAHRALLRSASPRTFRRVRREALEAVPVTKPHAGQRSLAISSPNRALP